MDAFLVALVMVFLAEMGDKRQFSSMALSKRTVPGTLFSGIALATATGLLLSVLVGRFLGSLVPEPWLQFLEGVSFLVLGIWSLRRNQEETVDDPEIGASPNSLPTVFLACLVGGLGDKAMWTTASLAAEYRFAALPVWSGSILGRVAADGLGLGIWWLLGTVVPVQRLRLVAAVVFLSFGGWSAWSGGRDLAPTAWAGAAICLVGATLILFRSRFRSSPVED